MFIIARAMTLANITLANIMFQGTQSRGLRNT